MVNWKSFSCCCLVNVRTILKEKILQVFCEQTKLFIFGQREFLYFNFMQIILIGNAIIKKNNKKPCPIFDSRNLNSYFFLKANHLLNHLELWFEKWIVSSIHIHIYAYIQCITHHWEDSKYIYEWI